MRGDGTARRFYQRVGVVARGKQWGVTLDGCGGGKGRVRGGESVGSELGVERTILLTREGGGPTGANYCVRSKRSAEMRVMLCTFFMNPRCLH